MRMPKIKEAAENKFYELFKQILDTQSREIELLLEMKEQLSQIAPDSVKQVESNKGWGNL